MPSKSYRQQVRMSPQTRTHIAELAAIWAGPEGPLTPSEVIRVCVERAWKMEERAWWKDRAEAAKR